LIDERLERRDGVWKIAYRLTVSEWGGRWPAVERTGDGAGDGPGLPADIFVHGTWDRTDASYRRPLVSHRPFRNIYEDATEP